MHQIVCDKCKRTEPVQWTQMFIGWTVDKRPLVIEAGGYTSIDKHKGEWLEQVGHGNLPIPKGWQYKYDEDRDDIVPAPEHLCPECREPDV